MLDFDPGKSPRECTILSVRALASATPQFLEEILTAVQGNPSNYLQEAVSASIQKYVGAEMDTVTPGKRGYGRATEYVPRLGGWFRSEIKRLSEERRDYLACLITQAVCNGYALVLLTESTGQGLKMPRVWASDDLFKAWIPTVYVFDPRSRGFCQREDIPAIEKIGNAGAQVFKQQFERRVGLKVGFLRAITFHTMAYSYFNSGMCLRFVETSTVAYNQYTRTVLPQ